MSSGFAKPITIKEAIDNIDHRLYLLPAIQRKFVWNSEQIEKLFDSIMRGYPINSFMFWEVKDPRIKNEFKFYQFLTHYRQFFNDNNPDIETKGYKDFYAVIDGQQRLTSIYLGLKGSFAYKVYRKWLYDTEDSLPTRHLYLNLSEPLPDENERQMEFDFQFLTKWEAERYQADESQAWFKVNDILRFSDRSALDNFIDDQGWISRPFTKATIRKLHSVIFDEPLINFYLEKSQEIDTVLDIFIRTNSGGEPLSFSDLLMSITTANWKSDARKEIHELVNKVYEIGRPGFLISKDFVLKCCLVLFNDNIKFQIKNFDQSNVIVFESNWDKVKKSIIEAFTLLADLGFNNSNLKAKNAAIPIVYYIFYRGIEGTINQPNKHQEEKVTIRQWLCISLLKGVFGTQSDNVLAGIRRALFHEINHPQEKARFPLDRIKDEFRGNPSKNLQLDEDMMDDLLNTQMEDGHCFTILSLLYSHLNFNKQEYHKDHIHPANYFNSIRREDFQSDEDYSFYSNYQNWNSIINLQLLNNYLNTSKKDKPLADWINECNVDTALQLIPAKYLAISDFKEFVQERKAMLKKRLKELVN